MVLWANGATISGNGISVALRKTLSGLFELRTENILFIVCCRRRRQQQLRYTDNSRFYCDFSTYITHFSTTVVFWWTKKKKSRTTTKFEWQNSSKSSSIEHLAYKTFIARMINLGQFPAKQWLQLLYDTKNSVIPFGYSRDLIHPI